MKFLSTWLRNPTVQNVLGVEQSHLNEVPEHMAQELHI